jgi:hypothetical protein
MDGHQDLHARIDQLCARAARDGADPEVVEEINDVLSEGYARALVAERALVALNERLVELVLASGERPEQQIRAVAEERRVAADLVERLRARLANLHEYFVVVAGQ